MSHYLIILRIAESIILRYMLLMGKLWTGIFLFTTPCVVAFRCWFWCYSLV